mmetsp:Transcript_27845/g.42639  ORF Transcript_27845/g.42639 Transcript_27845/m.42639 type:complete len:127 (-) Transcript_27845:206-586(-)
MMTMAIRTILLFFSLYLTATTIAWTAVSLSARSFSATTQLRDSSSKAEPSDETDSSSCGNDNKQQQQQEWGVSYIGGDPCGSKYNDDPFDAAEKISKPGMPDDMKARIQAMAEQKLKEAEKKKDDR